MWCRRFPAASRPGSAGRFSTACWRENDMADVLYVATRKGLLTFARAGGGWRLARTAFLGEPVSMVLGDRRGGHLEAALNRGQVGPKRGRATDTGQHGQEIAAPAFAASEEGEGSSVTM